MVTPVGQPRDHLRQGVITDFDTFVAGSSTALLRTAYLGLILSAGRSHTVELRVPGRVSNDTVLGVVWRTTITPDPSKEGKP